MYSLIYKKTNNMHAISSTNYSKPKHKVSLSENCILSKVI